MDLLLGGPGTGKTTALVRKITEIKPDNFALLTFTRQAAQEAKLKLSKFYSDRQMDWVRTIHSLAFKCLRLSKGSIFDHSHLMDFGKEYGFTFTNKFRWEEDGTYEELTEDDITYRQMLLDDITEGSRWTEGDGIDLDAVRYMRIKYGQYKVDAQLLDFNDILKRTLNAITPHFDLLCVDEAQDLSPLQWLVIDKIVRNCNKVIYAGDDDQMIYEWAGVDRKHFMKLCSGSEIEILDKNWRLPVGLFLESSLVIRRCKDRIDKSNITTMCNDNKDSIRRIPDFDAVESFKPNLSYLILARNNHYLKDIKWMLNEMNIKWCYLQYIDPKIKSNIKLSTIHGSKGAEADVVILFTDVTGATYENITNDSEHRVWYVGMTRARKELWIIEPRTNMYYDI